MNGKSKGSRAERRAIRILEAAGYVCTKAGGSLGLFDVIAIGPSDVRCVQVKANEYLSGIEREQLRALPVPANVTREYWRFVDGEPGKPADRNLVMVDCGVKGGRLSVSSLEGHGAVRRLRLRVPASL